MASLQFNISKGREVQFYDNIDSNNPANSAFIMMVLASGSANGLNGLIDFDTFAAILAGGYTEVTNANYARKTLTDTDLSPWSPDDINNNVVLTLPLQSWLNVGAGDTWDLVIVGYDSDTTGGTDANIVPVTASEVRSQLGVPIVPNTSTVIIDYSNLWITAS